MTDFELLHQYASQQSEAAFAALVERYGGLAYSAALRQTGRPQDAEDITQVVFIILARKAAALSSGTILAGWLLRTTHFVVLNARRRESRRWRTEMNATELYETETEATWKRIAPILDEALVSLSQKDRDALALRFFEQRSFRDIAQVLGTSEDAAQKRVSRALEKLKGTFTQRGVVVPSALVVAAISSNAVQAMPVHLLASLATKIVSGIVTTSSASELTQSSLSALARRRAKTLASRSGVAIVLVLLTTFGIWLLKSPSSGSRNVAQTSPLPQAQPPPLGPNGAAIARPQLGPGMLLLHVVDDQRSVPIVNAQLRSISGKTNLLRTDREGAALVSFEGNKEGLWNWRIEILKDGYEPRFINWGALRGDMLEDMPTEYTAKLERGHVIGGIVADEKGGPISDARILIIDSSMPGGLMGGGLMEREARRDGLALTHVETTDSQGVWMCNHVPEQLETVTYTVSHPEYVAATFRAVKIRPPTGGEEHVSEDDLRNRVAVLLLKPGRVVAGVVADETGKPIAGAKVTENRAWSDPAANQCTAWDGRFHFGNVSQAAKLILTAQCPGYVGADKILPLGGQTEDARFALKKAGVLRGQVLNERGEPVVKAGIIPLGDDFDEHRFEANILTDESGRFEWLSAPPSQRLYAVWAVGYKSSGRIELKSDGSDQLITLTREARQTPTTRIFGTVTDARTGRPIEDFQVWAVATLRQNASSMTLAPELKTTGTGGKFSFLALQETGAPLEKLDIEIRAEGYLSARSTVQAPLSNKCELSLRAEPFAVLTGTVQTPNGEPAVGAQVFLCAPHMTAWGASESEGAYMSIPRQVDMRLTHAASAVADDTGQFTLEPRTTMGTLLAIHRSGYAELRIDGQINPRTVRLEPWGAVSGTLWVIDKPGVGKVVSLDNPISAEPSALRLHLTATTDSTGHFVFENVPPSQWTLFPHNVNLEIHPGKTAEVVLGGGGRKVTGKINCKDPSLALAWKDYTLSLVTELPGLAAPNREAFSSELEFVAAHRTWFSRKSDFLRSPAGQAALRNQRRYSCCLAFDGSFSFEEVLPGRYELTLLREPSRPKSWMVSWLADFVRQVEVPETGDREAAILDVGELQLNKP